jgi:hypothetical protein
VLRTTVTGPLVQLLPDTVQEFPLCAVTHDSYLLRDPQTQTWLPVVFYALPNGERFLHFRFRATPKVS